MPEKVFSKHIKDRSGAAKIEYIAILATLVVGVPLAITQVPRFIGERSCAAESIVDYMSDCIVSELQAGDLEFVTFQGVPVDMDLTDGAQESFEIAPEQNSSLSFPFFSFVSEAQAGINDSGEVRRNPGSRLPIENVEGRRPGESLRDYIRTNREARGLPVDNERIDARRRDIEMKDVGIPAVARINALRAGVNISLSTARLENLGDGRMRFDPGSDFDVLRSGEHAVVEVPFTLIGTRDDEAEATARIIVHGFHADDDVATTWGRESVEIDLFANDHLPQLRQQISLGHMVPPARGSVSFANGVATFTPSADHAQLKSGESDTITFSYGIVGPMGATDTASVTVTVQGFSAEPDTATTWQDVPVDIDVLANDHGGQRTGLTLVSVTQPSRGSVSIVGDRLRFDPGGAFADLLGGQSESATFSYVVQSPDTLTSATADVNVTVNGFTVSPDVAVTYVPTPVDIDVLANDNNGQIAGFTVASVTQPSKGSVSIVNNRVRFNPGTAFGNLAPGAEEKISFSYTARTPDGRATRSAPVEVTVNGFGVVADVVSTWVGTTETIDVLANDNGGNIQGFTVTSVTVPSRGSASVVSNRVRYVAGSSAFADVPVGGRQTIEMNYTVRAPDGVTTRTAPITVTVDKFGAANDAAVTWHDRPIDIDVLANDFGGRTQGLSIASVTQPSKGSVSIVNNRVRFNPGTAFDSLPPGANETATFSYTVRSPDGRVSANASVAITVNRFGAAADVATTWQDVPIDIDVLANDYGGRPAGLTIASVTQPSKGTVSIVNNRIRFNPGTAFSGMSPGTNEVVQFSYVVRSPDGATTATATVSLTVRAYTYSFSYGAWSSCSQGSWSGWSNWSSCSAICGGGTQTRNRSCNTSGTQTRSVTACVRSDGASVSHSLCGTPVTTQSCAASCSGSSSESQACNTMPCTLSGTPCPSQNIVNGTCQQYVCWTAQHCWTEDRSYWEQVCRPVSVMVTDCVFQPCSSWCTSCCCFVTTWGSIQCSSSCSTNWCTVCTNRWTTQTQCNWEFRHNFVTVCSPYQACEWRRL